MADGEEIPSHGIQISQIDVEPLITNLFGIWRPGLVLTPPVALDIKPWVLIPEDKKILDIGREINKAAHEAWLGAERAKRKP